VAEQAEHAALALRRAANTGQDHNAAVAELLAAAATLATLRNSDNEEPPTPKQTSATQNSPVTKSVTDTAAQPRPTAPTSKSHHPPADPVQRPGKRVTKSVTKQATRQDIKRERRPQPIDPNTVRLERSADYDITGTWKAMAGPANDPILVGFVHRNSLNKKWEARTPALVTISGDPWRTRQDALIHLLLDHQPTASRSSSRRPR